MSTSTPGPDTGASSRMKTWLALALVVVVAVAGLVAWRLHHDGHAPNASAEGVFPAEVGPDEAFGQTRLVLVKGWAATPGRTSFDVNLPRSPQGQLLFIRCDRGKESLDFGGSTASGPCTGAARGVIGNPRGPGRGGHVRVSVDQGQSSTWGFAVYEPAP